MHTLVLLFAFGGAADRLGDERFRVREAAEARLNSAKEVVQDTKLSAEERTQKIKQIFGLC